MEESNQSISAEEVKRLFRISDVRTIESYIKEGVLVPVETGGAYQDIIFDRNHICKITGLKAMPDEPLMTAPEAMDFLGYPRIRKVGFRTYCRTRRIPHYTFKIHKGSRMYFLRSELEAVKNSEATWSAEFADFVARNYMLGSIIHHVFNSTLMMRGLKEAERDIINRILFQRKGLSIVSKEVGMHPEQVRRVFTVGCKRLLFQLKMLETQMGSAEMLAKENVQLKLENRVLLKKLNEAIAVNSGVEISEPEISVLSRQLQSAIPVLGTNLAVRVEGLIKELRAETLSDITKYRRSDIEKYQNVGKKTIDALELILINNGLGFQQEELFIGKDKRGKSRGANSTGSSIRDALTEFEVRLDKLEKKSK
jgi:hypothetical protein